MNYHLSAVKFRWQGSLVPLRVLRCNEHSVNTDWGVCIKDRVERLTWKRYNLYLYTQPMQGTFVNTQRINEYGSHYGSNKKMNHKTLKFVD